MHLVEWRATVNSWCSLAGTESPPSEVVNRLFADLHTGYAGADRRYHTWTHISECLELFGAFREAGTPGVPELDGSDLIGLELAIWFHDVVYAPGSADNERDSASAARAAARELGLDACGEVAHDLVLATDHSGTGASRDKAFPAAAPIIVDIDLWILGAPPDRFDEYQGQIAAEYSSVPKEQFSSGRAMVLRAFLDRDVIYALPYFRHRFEEQARANLRRALTQLEQTRRPRV